MPVEPIMQREYRDSRFDLSDTYLGTISLYSTAANKLAFLYQMTGEEKYAHKSFEFAEQICDLDTWVGRACQFPKAYWRVSPWNAREDKVVFTYDIYASEITRSMSYVYDWLYPALDKYQRDRIRSALLEKAIVQVRGNYEYHWWATAYRCNWCVWCNSGLGIAALVLINDDPQLVDVIAESYNRIWKTLDRIDEDGGWKEGAGYGFHTVHMTIYFGDALKRATVGTYNIFKNQKLAEKFSNFILYISAPPNKSAEFGDSHSGRFNDPTMSNKIALETGNKAFAWIRKNWCGQADDIFDVIWQKNTVEPELPAKTSLHFRTIDWVGMRSDFSDPEKVTVVCKTGMNNDTHHGHLDVGQFVLYWRGEDFICDHGAAAYDEKYFDEAKYDTPQAASRGHNLIFVNGEQQIPGQHWNQPTDETIGGKVLEFRDGAERVYTLMDPTNAYPKKELKRWRRHIILDKPVVTVVVDEVESNEGAEIEARFHSGAEQVVRDGYTLLHGKAGDMALIPVIDGGFTFRPGRHAYQALQKQADFQWIPYNGTVLKAKGTKTVIAHIILPVKDEKEARAVMKSAKRSFGKDGTFNLSFSINGTGHSYIFKEKTDGLVLE
jgi:hypothetical protein